MMLISVQVVGLRDLPRVRVHDLRDDPDQHAFARHEVLPTAGAVHAVPRHPQRHLHCLLHHGVRTQARGIPIQGKLQNRIAPIFLKLNRKTKTIFFS